MEGIDELKDEIEKLREAIEKQNEILNYQAVQRTDLYSLLESIKTYLRIQVDKYQEDAGIEKILIKPKGGDPDGIPTKQHNPAQRAKGKHS